MCRGWSASGCTWTTICWAACDSRASSFAHSRFHKRLPLWYVHVGEDNIIGFWSYDKFILLRLDCEEKLKLGSLKGHYIQHISIINKVLYFVLGFLVTHFMLSVKWCVNGKHQGLFLLHAWVGFRLGCELAGLPRLVGRRDTGLLKMPGLPLAAPSAPQKPLSRCISASGVHESPGPLLGLPQIRVAFYLCLLWSMSDFLLTLVFVCFIFVVNFPWTLNFQKFKFFF